jgi:hypothetical protein
VPHRRGSFNEDWNDLLTRFAQRRKHEHPRGEMLEQAKEEALQPFDPHQALFERAQRPATNSQTENARSSAAGGS